MRRVVMFALLLVAALGASVPLPLITAGTAAAYEANPMLKGHPKGKGRNTALPVAATGSTIRSRR